MNERGREQELCSMKTREEQQMCRNIRTCVCLWCMDTISVAMFALFDLLIKHADLCQISVRRTKMFQID